ncbi:MAG: DUF58 domain-containing protein [Thermoleophilaceae bacterium]
MPRALSIALLGAALCLAAGVFDTPSLYVPGIALVGITVAAVTWVRLAARGARVERAAGPAMVVEDEPYPLRVQLRSGVLPPPAGELLEPLLGWPVPVGGRWSRRIRLNVRFGRRGQRRLEPGLLVIRDPLGLDEVRIAGGGEERVLVLPRIEPVSVVGGGGGGLGGIPDAGHGAAGGRLDGSPAELEIDGLRPYREGAPATRIHWPTVARRGEMLERRLVADLDSAPLVVLDPSRPETEERLDAAVRAAASLCRHLAARGGCALLLPGERRALEIAGDLGSWPHAHARLALVESGPAPLAPPRAGAVFWVTAAAGRPPGLERAVASARYLVTPVPPSGARPLFSVAGCVGLRVGRTSAGRRAA